ncbi:MAG: DUF937 domain-containing protein [Pseudomarimonas sp.]
MQITDLLAQTGGLSQIARELGVSEQQATSAASALLPAILGGFKKQTQAQPSGFGGLGDLLGQLGGGGLLDDVLSSRPTEVSRGNDVLGQIFGSKDVSRTVAQSASAQTGLDPALLRKMLPMLAMLVTGFMAKQAGGGGASQGSSEGGFGGLGGLGGLLGGLLGGQSQASGAAPSSGGFGGLGGLASMLDANADGNALDDLLNMAGKALR